MIKSYHYGSISIDPPWQFITYSNKGKDKSPENHYEVMTLDDYPQLPLFDFEEGLHSQVLAHSTKPYASYKRIEQLTNGPYLQVFARGQITGWDAIGNEIDGQDIRDVLNNLEAKPK